MQQVEDRPGTNAPNQPSINSSSSSCINSPFGVLPRRQLGGVARFVAAFLLLAYFTLRFRIRYGGDDDGIGTTQCVSSETVRR